ncbi:UNVERIFIED_CONTAM: Ribulose bisphosphate carboxylase/oxygenase activase, chloroplastic [Sesamum radiatum]|uniref:Ribulose bisphosphate carboxylase/oxygenase activase, chloroplastic n=1 Tax=Sesamum radiatum TaxID=300843 RepID=A0AAW2NCX6_SESRA
MVNLNGSVGGAAVPSSSFLGMSLKKVNSSHVPKVSSGNFKVVAEVNEKKQTDQDRWKGLVEDISDDQQDITRGKGMVDSLFQAPTGSFDLGYLGRQRTANYDECWRTGKWNAGEPAKLIRQRYREAADIIKKGKMCCLFINDLDAGAGRLGGTTQYTVNNQMVNATLMNIADNPTNVQLPGMYNKEENPVSQSLSPGIFRTDNVPDEAVVTLVDAFPGQSIDFFGALRARVYDDEVRKWIGGVGVDNVGKKLVNSREGPPTFEQPKMTLQKLLEYGNMLVQEQENVKRVQLADKYLKDAALGDANKDAIESGTFFKK